jgi:purine-binding chemotaxis protein CheW
MPTSLKKVQYYQQYVTIELCGQLFGMPVLDVHDVLQDPRVNPIPLAPVEVAGSLNLRGRIVPAIDLRQRLSLPKAPDLNNTMGVVVEYGGEKYCLLVDDVGDVLTLDTTISEKPPSTLDSRWRNLTNVVYKLENRLLLILDVNKLLAEQVVYHG